MIFAAATLILAIATATPSPSPSAKADPVDVEAGVTHESLINNYPAWDSQYLRIMQRPERDEAYYLQFDTTDRFNQTDNQVTFGAYVPLSASVRAFAEADLSGTHRILPEDSIYGGLEFASGDKWYESIGARTTHYTSASVNAGTFSLEKYWGPNRFAYTLTAANLPGTGTDVEHALQYEYYYGKYDSNIGFSYVSGREVDNIGLPQVVTSHVDGFNVRGLLWMNKNWAFAYNIGSFQQGSFYTRAGGQIGVRYRF